MKTDPRPFGGPQYPLYGYVWITDSAGVVALVHYVDGRKALGEIS